MFSHKKCSRFLELQNDIDKLIARANKWQLRFKCYILHLGNLHGYGEKSMEGTIISSSNTINDLGIYIDSNLIFHFIKALQHKCWRSVGHQVLQPAKDGKLGQYVWKVADRRKKSMMHQDSLEPAAIRFTLERLQESVHTPDQLFLKLIVY